MNFKLTRKQATVIILLIIIIPIIYNKTSGFIIGMLQKQAMRMPKEVVVDNPHMSRLMYLQSQPAELKLNIQLM